MDYAITLAAGEPWAGREPPGEAAGKAVDMRIGMLVDMYKPHISGITNYVVLNKRWLEARGHKVFVFTFGDEAYEDDELYIVRSPGLPVNVHDTGFHLSFRYALSAQRRLQTMDVVHVHHPFLSGPLALRYCKPQGIPILYTNHTRFDLYAQHYLPPLVPDAVGETFLRAYLPNFCQQCERVIAPSPGIARVMRALGVNADIAVIPNGIDFTPYENPPPLARREVGLPDEAVVLMYVGRLSPEKNLALLLRAFFGVAAAYPQALLAIVGGGPELENLRDQAGHSGLAERVRFLGKVEYQQVPSYLRLADAFVTASDTEVHPFSLIEAMASGLPALGIDSPGVGDTIVDGENGFLSPLDIAAFTAKMMRLVMEGETRRRMSERALQTARLYDINRTGQLMLDEYTRVAAERQERLTGWQRLRRRVDRLLNPRTDTEPGLE
jgi:glycosyltransferase involved in cell wall biosynthesis